MSVDLKSNRNRFVLQGFFLVAATTAADPSTVLPLIVDFFGGNEILVGVLVSLLRGGAIIMQLWAAFHAQSYKLVLPSLRIVFVARGFIWFFIGLFFYFFGTSNPTFILWIFSILVFLFSFSAGFGVVYYQELRGKAFTKEYRGKTIAIRQIASGFAGILSGGLSGYILSTFDKPESFAYLFIISSIAMATGFAIFWNFKEEKKEKISKRENNFGDFLKNAGKLLKNDRDLKYQIITRLISYSLFFVFPFVILKVKSSFGIEGKDVGSFIFLMMLGAMLSNLLWGKLSSLNKNKLIIIISFILAITVVLTAVYATNIYFFYALYFLAGAATDGFRLAFGNMILIIAPPEKRPVYIAVQNNITSVGIFFSIPGGVILHNLNFEFLSFFSISILFIGLIFSFKIKNC